MTKYHLEIQVKSSIPQNELLNSLHKTMADLPINFLINPLNKNQNHVIAEFQGVMFFSDEYSPNSFRDAFWHCIVNEARKQLQIDETSSIIKLACIDASKSMISSLLGTNPLISGLSENIHISNIQIRNFTLLSLSTYLSELLYDLGEIAGQYGGFISFVEEPLLKSRSATIDEHFLTAMQSLVDFYSRTSDMGLNIAKKAVINEHGQNSIILRLFELPASAGIPDIEQSVCHFDAGLISGIVETLIGTPVNVTEIQCWGQGAAYCDFRIKLDDNTQKIESSQESIPIYRDYYKSKILKSLIRNEHLSIREGRNIRNGISDYVHPSLFKLFFSTLASIGDIGHFLLVSAGMKHGRGVAIKYGKPEALSINQSIEFTQKLASEQKLLAGGTHSGIEMQEDRIILHSSKAQPEPAISSSQHLYFYEVGFFSGLLSELTKTDIWLTVDVPSNVEGRCELIIE